MSRKQAADSLPKEQMEKLNQAYESFIQKPQVDIAMEGALLSIFENILNGESSATGLLGSLKKLGVTKENDAIGLCIANVLWLMGTQVRK